MEKHSFFCRREANKKANREKYENIILKYFDEKKQGNAFDISIYFKCDITSIRPRLTEMCSKGLIRQIGKAKTEYSDRVTTIYGKGE